MKNIILNQRTERDALMARPTEELQCHNLLVITQSQEEIITWKGLEVYVKKVAKY